MNFVFYQSNEIISFSFFTFTNKKITEYIFHSNLTYIFFSLYHLLIVWKFVKFGAFILIYWMKFYISQNFNRQMIFFFIRIVSSGQGNSHLFGWNFTFCKISTGGWNFFIQRQCFVYWRKIYLSKSNNDNEYQLLLGCWTLSSRLSGAHHTKRIFIRETHWPLLPYTSQWRPSSLLMNV